MGEHTYCNEPRLAVGDAAGNMLEDLPSRHGGDELAVLLPGILPGARAAVRERLRESVQDLRLERGSSAAVQYGTLGIGGAPTVPNEENGVIDLIATADRKLYAAKAKGSNQSVAHC